MGHHHSKQGNHTDHSKAPKRSGKHNPVTRSQPDAVPNDVWMLVLGLLHPFDLRSVERVCFAWRERVVHFRSSAAAASTLRLRERIMKASPISDFFVCFGFTRDGHLALAAPGATSYELHLLDNELERIARHPLPIPPGDAFGSWALIAGAMSADTDEVLLVMYRSLRQPKLGAEVIHYTAIATLNPPTMTEPLRLSNTPAYAPIRMVCANISSAYAVCQTVQYNRHTLDRVYYGVRGGGVAWRPRSARNVGVLRGRVTALVPNAQDKLELVRWLPPSDESTFPVPIPDSLVLVR